MAGTENEFEVLEKIGQGSFGVIRKVRRKADGEILCRKEISYTRMSEKEKNQLHAELRILESLQHPNIVQYSHRNHLKSSHDLHLYMEYCGNGDLGGYIRKLKDRNRMAEEDFIWTIFAQLVSALYRCHNGEDPPLAGKEGKALLSKKGHTKIIHRDLKPENVFLGENNSVKLGDFGLSKIIASHDFASTYVGTPFYMSPEICAAEAYTHSSDIWSLGCIIYELATRRVPFEARSHMELILKIKNGRISSLPAQYSQDLWDAISWCLQTNPTKRPDCAQLLSFANIKVARTRLEQASALGQLDKVISERDAALSKLQAAQKQLQQLESEVLKLKEANKKVEMEWHTRATLAIDEKVKEANAKNLAELRARFDIEVDQRAEEKLALHLASLPSYHNPSSKTSSNASSTDHVRSSTPPPGKHATTAAFSNFSRNLPDPSVSSLPDILGQGITRPSSSSSAFDEPDLSSLSLTSDPALPLHDDASPLARRVANPPPKKSTRKPFTRAKTLANCNFGTNAARDSPMDVHMASPSPMHQGYAQQSGARFGHLGLSPRRNAPGIPQADGGAGAARDPLKRNIFSMVASSEKASAAGKLGGSSGLGEKEKENRPPVRGRTLVELSSQRGMQSPAKWNHGVHVDEMPSPWVKKR